MPLLNGTLPLHDPRCKGHDCRRLRCITDTERFCARALNTETRRRQITHIDHERALTELIEEAWWLAQRYNPQRSSSISTYVYSQLGNRLTNWLHRELIRNPDHHQPTSLEDLPAEPTQHTGTDDPTPHLVPDLLRGLLQPRAGDTPAAINEMGRTQARRIVARTRRTTPRQD